MPFFEGKGSIVAKGLRGPTGRGIPLVLGGPACVQKGYCRCSIAYSLMCSAEKEIASLKLQISTLQERFRQVVALALARTCAFALPHSLKRHSNSLSCARAGTARGLRSARGWRGTRVVHSLQQPCTHKAQAPPLVLLAQPAFVAACALHKSVCRPSYALSLEVRFKCDGLAKPTRSDRIMYDRIR